MNVILCGSHSVNDAKHDQAITFFLNEMYYLLKNCWYFDNANYQNIYGDIFYYD